jgi:hypothetical protein
MVGTPFVPTPSERHGAQGGSGEARSNPEPRAAPYSEHGEDCEHWTLTRPSTV